MMVDLHIVVTIISLLVGVGTVYKMYVAPLNKFKSDTDHRLSVLEERQGAIEDIQKRLRAIELTLSKMEGKLNAG